MAGIGHNSLTDDEQKALLFHHARKEIEITAQIKALQNERSVQRKNAQADGIALDRLDYAIKVLNAEDKKRLVDAEKERLQILKWTKLVPDYQGDLFADRAPVVERITGEGERAGLLGKDGVSPYTTGSEEDKAWLNGWRNGQNILAKNFESARAKLDDNDDDDEDPFPDGEEQTSSNDNVVPLK